MNLKTLIIDDERKARETLQMLLETYCPEVSICGMASNIKEAKNLILEENPELLFLDVDMPGGSGFDLLNEIGDFKVKVIFTTAHNEYAIKAIKVDAADYLLKPIDVFELKDAVKKVLEERNSNLITPKKEDLESKKIAISDQTGIEFINPTEIMFCKADSNYTEIHLHSGSKITSSKTLKEYEDILDSTIFYRIHQSYLINILFAKKYIKGDGGFVQMQDDTQIEVSRRKKKDFLARMANI